jgi:hypothetical protein
VLKTSCLHQFVPLPFHAECFGPVSDASVNVAKSAVSAEVNLATGAVTARSEGHHPRRPAEVSVALAGLGERVHETPEGPLTELADASGHAARFMGELTCAARSGHFVLGVVSMPGPRSDCVAFSLGSPLVLRLPAAPDARVALGSGIAACAAHDHVHVFRFGHGAIQSVSVPIPHTPEPDLHVALGRVCVLSGDRLLLIDAQALPFGETHVASSISYAALTTGGAQVPDPATVAFVFSDKILVDHPRFKRLTLAKTPGCPEVVKGDQVMIDDVREELPGIFRVYAWRKAGAGGSVRPPPAPLELPRPAIAPLSEDVPSSEVTAPETGGPPSPLARLHDLSARHGFRASDCLVRLLAERERDPVFRRWLDKIGFDLIEVRSLTPDWDADPCLLAFAGLGNGDEYCLYVYPPWCADGREPPVVEYWHETNFVDFRALDFESFLVRELDSRVADGFVDDELARLIRERLALPSAGRDAGEAPEFLPLDQQSHAAPALDVEAALELERRGDAAAAERALLRQFLLGGDLAAAARKELERLYAKLAWSFPLENLAQGS